MPKKTPNQSRQRVPVLKLDPSEIAYLKENGMWKRWQKSGWTSRGNFKPK